MSEYLEFAKKLANRAGEIMLQYYYDDVEQHTKEDESVVTIADETINQYVIDEVAKTYPTHSVLGEEADAKKDSEYAWVCDPIDGTVPYSKGVPISVFSLALVKNGVPIVGVVNDPFSKRLYTAIKGEGAFCNDQPIKVSTVQLGYQATINRDWWPKAEIDIVAPLHKLSLDTKTYVLQMGSVVQAACLVASGKYEAAIFAGSKGENVDIAAVKVIIEEAGGKVTNIFGEEQRYDQDIYGAVMTNGLVHNELLNYFKDLPK